MTYYNNINKFARRNWILILILVFSVVLSSYRIKDCQITMDEFYSINIAQRSLGEIWSLKPHPGTFYFNMLPPLYETALHFVWNLSKESLLWSRIFSVFSNTIAILLVFLISKLLFEEKVGLVAAFLASLNYAHIFFSKMIRCYSLLNLLTLASFYIFFRIAKDKINDKMYWVFLLLVNVFILYTFYFGAFVILLELILAGLFFQRKKLVKMWLWLLSTFLFFLPWLGHLLKDLSMEPSLHFKISKIDNFLKALLFRFREGIFHDTGLLLLYSGICIYFIFYGIFLLIKKENKGLPIVSLLIILLAPALIINYLTAEVYSNSSFFYIKEGVRARYTFPYIFPFFILAGLFVNKFSRNIGRSGFFVLLALSLYAINAYFRLPSQQFWPAPFVTIVNEAKDFQVRNTDKIIIEIEDSFFVPVFVYYFYGPKYFRGSSAPYGGANLKQLNNGHKGNYKTFFNVAGIKDLHKFNSVEHLKNSDWLFLIYSNWLEPCWGKSFRKIYDEKIKERGMQDKIVLVKQVCTGQFTLEVYKIINK